MKLFEVGGCVRDEILGVPSKDIDFTVVLEPHDFYIRDGAFSRDPFMVMVTHLESMGFKIFLETPEFFTVRAQFPKGMIAQKDFAYRGRHTTTADFVLARKESDYTDGRRPDAVVPGTLEDDLARRDFTMNAIAKDADGSYIDPFNGRGDIAARIVRAVGDPLERLREDALRAVRAIRFAVTKGFFISRSPGEYDFSLNDALEAPVVLRAIETQISDERIREELSKMFRFDTLASIQILGDYPLLTEAMFAGSVSLDATMKLKGRGK